MTYDPHYRVTMSGTTLGGEIFSMGLSLGPFAPGALFDLAPDDTQFTDVANDCAAWFARPGSRIRADAVLKLVKIAPIGSDGHYSGLPAERAFNQPGGGSSDSSFRQPNQVALAVTLHTAGDLGRVKGRWYQPCPDATVQADGRILTAVTDLVEASALELINDLNNQPGLDFAGFKVVVASQGRRRNNVQVVPPTNHEVTAVSVGSVLDTQRRRRNKLVEQRSPTLVDS